MDKAPKDKKTLANIALKHEGTKYMKKVTAQPVTNDKTRDALVQAKLKIRRLTTTTEDRWFSSYREGLTAQTGTNETRTERTGCPSPTTHRPSEPRPGSTGARPLRKSAPSNKQSQETNPGRNLS